MLEVIQGATIVGKSGKKLLVEKVDGELIFCANGIKVRRDRVFYVIPPPPTPLHSQEDRSLENILSVTETLQVVVKMCDSQAIEALIDLRHVWDKNYSKLPLNICPSPIELGCGN